MEAPARVTAAVPWHRRLEARVALGVSFLVALSLGAALFAASQAVTRQSQARASADLRAARATFDRLVDLRAASSAALTRLVTELPIFRAHLSDHRLADDMSTMNAMTDGYCRQLQATFCIVTSATGDWISNVGWPEERGHPAVLQEMIASTLQSESQTGIASFDRRVFLLVTEPIRFATETLGVMAVAHALDDQMAEDLARVSNVEVNIVSGAILSASSLRGPARVELERSLGQSVSTAHSRLQPFGRFGGIQYFTGSFPISPREDVDPSEARLMLLQDWRPTEAFLADLRKQFLAAAAVIFSFALAGGIVFGRRTSRPVREIAVAAGDIAAGNWSRQVPVDGSVEEATMAEAFNAMSASLRATHERLVHDAFHDPLTSLPNRALFMDRLRQSFVRKLRHPEYLFAVLFIDLDRFKNVNDSIGHTAGDSLLLEVSARLNAALRQVDTVARQDEDGAQSTLARVGGDEFTVLIEDLKDPSDAVRVAERIQNAVAVPMILAGQDVFTSASVGIAVVSPTHRTSDDLVRDADIAMYRAKASGGACCALFDASMHQRAVDRLKVETDLRRAIERREFVVAYEPIVALDGQRVVGYEALVRWQHPERGLLAPAAFLRVAEETGLIAQIDEWVLNQACEDARRWADAATGTAPGVSVNVSAAGFAQADIVGRVARALKASNLPAGSLRLEITESVAMRDAERATAVMSELRALGVRLSLDDFGTGYSSLSYLLRFPVDTLKIDRSFVRGVVDSEECREIARTIVHLAHTLHLDVIAEGTETVEQVEFLESLGCGYGQGHLFTARERVFQHTAEQKLV